VPALQLRVVLAVNRVDEPQPLHCAFLVSKETVHL
jgi:hypothetical protein